VGGGGGGSHEQTGKQVAGRTEGWPLHGIAITNMVWCMGMA